MGVLGDLMLDRYLWGTASRLSPEAAVPVVDFVEQSECLGGAGNVAANLSALGARVECFGAIGNDEPGAALRKCLCDAGIVDKGVLADSRRVTTVKPRSNISTPWSSPTMTKAWSPTISPNVFSARAINCA